MAGVRRGEANASFGERFYVFVLLLFFLSLAVFVFFLILYACVDLLTWFCIQL